MISASTAKTLINTLMERSSSVTLGGTQPGGLCHLFNVLIDVAV